MFAERTGHQTRFTERSVRQNSRSTTADAADPPALPADAHGHNQQDTFGLMLAAQLREVCDPSFGLTSGANRQIRQLGTPLTQFVNPRSEGRVIVATRAAEV